MITPSVMTARASSTADHMSELVLQFDSVSYSVSAKRRGPSRVILGNVDLELRAGESVAIRGQSGSGKSTLLALALGLIKPTSGKVVVAEQEISSLRPGALARLRSQNMGVVFQAGELLPQLSVLDNIALPALLHGGGRTAAYARAEELLSMLGLDVAATPTDRLSGGERQRVALARALINQPACLLADEPTGALDAETRDQVCAELFKLPGLLGTALLVVTHDPAVSAWADRTLWLQDSTLLARQ